MSLRQPLQKAFTNPSSLQISKDVTPVVNTSPEQTTSKTSVQLNPTLLETKSNSQSVFHLGCKEESVLIGTDSSNLGVTIKVNHTQEKGQQQLKGEFSLIGRYVFDNEPTIDIKGLLKGHSKKTRSFEQIGSEHLGESESKEDFLNSTHWVDVELIGGSVRGWFHDKFTRGTHRSHCAIQGLKGSQHVKDSLHEFTHNIKRLSTYHTGYKKRWDTMLGTVQQDLRTFYTTLCEADAISKQMDARKLQRRRKRRTAQDKSLEENQGHLIKNSKKKRDDLIGLLYDILYEHQQSDPEDDDGIKDLYNGLLILYVQMSAFISKRDVTKPCKETQACVSRYHNDYKTEFETKFKKEDLLDSR